MTNRKLVQGLIGAYAGFVVGVTVIGSSVNLLGSTLNFFTDPTSTQRLAEFDDDGDNVPDLINGPRILEIFRFAPNVFAPLFGHPTMVPNMIRLDDAFEMPATSTHPAASAKTAEPTGSFDAVAPKWEPEEIRVSNQFQGGNAAPGMYLVPVASPSSSLPATLMMPPPGPPSSTPPAVTAPPSNTPPVSSAPPTSVPPTATSSSASSVDICEDGEDNDGDGDTDAADNDCDTVYNPNEGSSSSAASICEDGEDNDGDGDTDSTDNDCDTVYNPNEGSSSSAASICEDGEDNDGDGSTDFLDVDCDAGSDYGEDSSDF